MQYKTLVLQLLRSQFHQLHTRLKESKTLLAELDRYSTELKRSHNLWTDSLSERKPGSDPSQIKSEALEIALQELEDRLRDESQPGERPALSLDSAITFLKARTESD